MKAATRRWVTWAVGLVLILFGGVVVFVSVGGEKLYDPNFDTRIAEPAYRTERPRVLYDEGHLNLHTADGRYKGFVDLIKSDGYEVQINREAFTADRLAGVTVLVIVGARGPGETENASAFTESEIIAVQQFVQSGGSLLLNVDHYPFGAAAELLGRRLGVDMTNGIVEDPIHFERGLGQTISSFPVKIDCYRITRLRGEEMKQNESSACLRLRVLHSEGHRKIRRF